MFFDVYPVSSLCRRTRKDVHHPGSEFHIYPAESGRCERQLISLLEVVGLVDGDFKKIAGSAWRGVNGGKGAETPSNFKNLFLLIEKDEIDGLKDKQVGDDASG